MNKYEVNHGNTLSLQYLKIDFAIEDEQYFYALKIINNLIPSKREIAMVFQSYALYPHMSVFENMAFGLRMHKVDKLEIDSRVKQAAET